MKTNLLRLRYWSIFALLMALIPCWLWLHGELPRRDEELHADFAFLEQARHAVLPGNSYTVRARDRATESRLFDASLALTPNRVAVRTRYGRDGRALRADARYVIAYRDYTGGEKLHFVVRFDRGAVYERLESGSR